MGLSKQTIHLSSSSIIRRSSDKICMNYSKLVGSIFRLILCNVSTTCHSHNNVSTWLQVPSFIFWNNSFLVKNLTKIMRRWDPFCSTLRMVQIPVPLVLCWMFGQLLWHIIGNSVPIPSFIDNFLKIWIASSSSSLKNRALLEQQTFHFYFQNTVNVMHLYFRFIFWHVSQSWVLSRVWQPHCMPTTSITILDL